LDNFKTNQIANNRRIIYDSLKSKSKINIENKKQIIEYTIIEEDVKLFSQSRKIQDSKSTITRQSQINDKSNKSANYNIQNPKNNVFVDNDNSNIPQKQNQNSNKLLSEQKQIVIASSINAESTKRNFSPAPNINKSSKSQGLTASNSGIRQSSVVAPAVSTFSKSGATNKTEQTPIELSVPSPSITNSENRQQNDKSTKISVTGAKNFTENSAAGQSKNKVIAILQSAASSSSSTVKSAISVNSRIQKENENYTNNNNLNNIVKSNTANFASAKHSGIKQIQFKFEYISSV